MVSKVQGDRCVLGLANRIHVFRNDQSCCRLSFVLNRSTCINVGIHLLSLTGRLSSPPCHGTWIFLAVAPSHPPLFAGLFSLIPQPIFLSLSFSPRARAVPVEQHVPVTLSVQTPGCSSLRGVALCLGLRSQSLFHVNNSCSFSSSHVFTLISFAFSYLASLYMAQCTPL